MRAIDNFDDRDFEALACVVLKIIGATHIRLNEGGNEGGVDFYATLKIHTKNHMFSNIGGALRVVGQSKKFSSSIQDSVVKEFCQTLVDIKQLSPSIREKIPSWFLTTRSPIIGWIISHNGFQSGATERAKNHGIIISDSLDIAEIIAVSKLPSCEETFDATKKIKFVSNNKNIFLDKREIIIA